MYQISDFHGDTNASRLEDERERLALAEDHEDAAHAAFLASERADCAAIDAAETRHAEALRMAGADRVIEFALDGWLKAVAPSLSRAAIAPGIVVRTRRTA